MKSAPVRLDQLEAYSAWGLEQVTKVLGILAANDVRLDAHDQALAELDGPRECREPDCDPGAPCWRCDR